MSAEIIPSPMPETLEYSVDIDSIQRKFDMEILPNFPMLGDDFDERQWSELEAFEEFAYRAEELGIEEAVTHFIQTILEPLKDRLDRF